MAALIQLGVSLSLTALLLALYTIGRGARRPRAMRRRDGARPLNWTQLAGQALVVSAVLMVIGVAAAFVAIGGNLVVEASAASDFADVRPDSGAAAATCGDIRLNGQPLVVVVVTGDDKQRWLARAAETFMQRCPGVQLRLIVRDDLAAADAILRGELRPTLWAATEELSLRYLDARWQGRVEAPFEIHERRSLARSPLVVLLREDRMRMLETIRAADRDAGGFWLDVPCPLVPRAPTLDDLHDADMLPGRWEDWYLARVPAPPEPPVPPRARSAAPPVDDPRIAAAEALHGWGRVKFDIPSPSQEVAGLSALVLAAQEFVVADEPASFTAALERDADGLRRWLQRCHAGRDVWHASARGLTEAFFALGPQRYDGVVTYEHLAFPLLERLDARELGELRVLYPRPGHVAAHPAVLMWPRAEEGAAERAAAQQWLVFLQSDEVQRLAVGFGLRPAAGEVPRDALDPPRNPFLDLRRFGVRPDLAVSEPARPDGGALLRLLELWGEAIGRR